MVQSRFGVLTLFVCPGFNVLESGNKKINRTIENQHIEEVFQSLDSGVLGQGHISKLQNTGT